MIDLHIDTSDLSEEFSMTSGEVDDMLEFTVDEVTSAFARKWDNEAKNNLHSTRNQYRNAIQVTKRGRFSGIVYLNPASWLANALELGASSFDMKKGFLSSSKVKYTSKGKPYITIPFRFATPGSIGESSAFAGVMPTVIHQAVLSRSKSGSRGGLSMSEIPKQYHIPQSATLRRKLKSKGMQTISRNVKTTSIYEGLKKQGGGYVMFRRVSLNSSPDAFNHPGFDARNFAHKALSQMDVPQTVDIAIDTYLSNLGF